MLKLNRSFRLFILISFFADTSCIAQDEQVKKEKVFKNTIMYNITNPLMFGFKTCVVGYERVLGAHQSAMVEGGLISFPAFTILPGTIRSNSVSKEKGYKIVLEYRFYPSAENKYNAPRGVYLAPYVTYNYFNRTKSFDIDTAKTGIPIEVSVNTDFTLQIGTIGAELGYQFVFWKRFALDLILIGPGLSSYSIKAKLSTSLDPDSESDLFKAINDALSERIPGYSLVIKPEEFNKKGTANTTSIGFRYLIHIGFRF